MANYFFLKKIMRIYVIFLSLLLSSSMALASSELDSLFLQLDQTMQQRDKYDAIKQNSLENLKSLSEEYKDNTERHFFFNNKIMEEYIAYNFDSAVHYIEINLALAAKYNNVKFKHETNIHLAYLLAFSGRYLEAVDVAKTVNTSELDLKLKREYWGIYTKVYSELALYCPTVKCRNKYQFLYDAYEDSLLSILDTQSEDYLAILEKKHRDTRKLIDCKRINTQRLNMAKMGTRTYSTITFERAILYELENQKELEKKYLILSAISDIKAAVKDNASLTKLAMILYDEEKIDDAYKYIMFSFEDAAFYNSKLRFIQISSILPLITEAYQNKSDQQKLKFRTYSVIISILSVILILSMLAINLQMKKLRITETQLTKTNNHLRQLNANLKDINAKLNSTNHELIESQQVKEHYIGSFLAICSDYINKLDDFRKMVNKNIVNRKVEELFSITKSHDLINNEIAEFYHNFDNVFLHIFPDFINKINQLLNDEGKLESKKGEALSTELRIFALIRLGISDSSKIAHLLRYSVNTIYNYRVKVKNNAIIPREEFEDAVMRIDSKIKIP